MIKLKSHPCVVCGKPTKALSKRHSHCERKLINKFNGTNPGTSYDRFSDCSDRLIKEIQARLNAKVRHYDVSSMTDEEFREKFGRPRVVPMPKPKPLAPRKIRCDPGGI